MCENCDASPAVTFILRPHYYPCTRSLALCRTFNDLEGNQFGYPTAGTCGLTQEKCRKTEGSRWSTDPGIDKIALAGDTLRVDSCCSKERLSGCKRKEDCEAVGVDGTWTTYKYTMELKDGLIARWDMTGTTKKSFVETGCCGDANPQGCLEKQACEDRGHNFRVDRGHPICGMSPASAMAAGKRDAAGRCCTATALNDCLTKLECEAKSGKWSDSSGECCGEGFEGLCSAEADCKRARGQWVGFQKQKTKEGTWMDSCVPSPPWSSEVSIPVGLADDEGCKAVQVADVDMDDLGLQDIVLLVGKVNKQGGTGGKQTSEIMRDGLADARYHRHHSMHRIDRCERPDSCVLENLCALRAGSCAS